MNRYRRYSSGAAIFALVAAVLLIVMPLRAESAADRIARMKKERDWVYDQLRMVRLYESTEMRENVASDIAQHEKDQSMLRRVMPESLSRTELHGRITAAADRAAVTFRAGEPILNDYGEYESITIRVTPEGTDDSIERFVRGLQLTPGVQYVTRIEKSGGGADVVEVEAFMMPSRRVELRACSIPERSPGASEAETKLRERLVSECAKLDAADAELRRALERREQLRDWVMLTNDLALNEPRVEPTEEVLAAAEADLGPELTAEIEDILGEPLRPPALDEGTKRAKAMDDIRWIATAAEAYAVDHDRYPESSNIVPLANTLTDYLSRAPGERSLTDPWEMPYRWISDGRNYRIVSGGRNRAIAETSLVISDNVQENDDLVYQNGTLLQAPMD